MEQQQDLIVGFDQSTRLVGFAVLDVRRAGQPRRVESGVIEGKGGTRHGRYASIRFQVRDLFKKYEGRIRSAAFEEGVLFKEPKDPAKRNRANPATALWQAEARGILMGIAIDNHVPFEVYMPATVKKAATGKGNSKKGQVAMFVTAFFGMAYALEDEADALAVGLAHANRIHAANVEQDLEDAAAGQQDGEEDGHGVA